MKAILYVVAILILGGAAYFTLEHKRKFVEVDAVRVKAVSDNKAVSANADAKEAELKKVNEEIAIKAQKREEVSQALEIIKNTGKDIQSELAGIEDTLKVQDEEFAELETARKQVATILNDLGGNLSLENLGDKIKEIDDELKGKQAELEELETNITTAENKLTNTRAEIERLVKRDMERSARISRNTMEAVVTAVNPEWGFLVIGAGSNTGFTPQTSLLIQRDGKYIGRVTPSSIEPTQTIAEIDPESLAPGARIQPGDRAILAKPASN